MGRTYRAKMTRNELWNRVENLSSESTIIEKSQTPSFRIVDAEESDKKVTIEYVEPYRLTIDFEDVLYAYEGLFNRGGYRSRRRPDDADLLDCIISALDERLTFPNLSESARELVHKWQEERAKQIQNNEINDEGDDDEYDDWGEWIDESGGRTPNDDRSDSMNPNSHRYNPGK